ncbi:response regulator transcription factor [Streptococcus pneumoniae]
MGKRILLVEHETNLARFLALELQKESYQIDVCETGQDGLRLAKENDYDLILLNYNLMDMTGEVFADELSVVKPARVMIVMEEREALPLHKESIQRFAVSYLVKPFIMSDLTDKISAIFRGRDFIDQHCSQMKIPTSYRNLRIDIENHLVYRGDEVIALTRREYDLLATLMGSREVMTREQLLERVWKYESTAETNVVDVYIRYLRGKIDLPGQKSYIKTIRGVGYSMQD